MVPTAVAIIAFAVRYGTLLAAGALAQPWVALFALLLVAEFFAPLRAYAAAYADRMHAQGAAGPLAALPVLPEAPPELQVRTVEARGVSVAFEDVQLTWDAARGPALDGLSFRVPAGEILVLAGPSGAGKSTVMEILLGFVQPTGGRVTINGADISTLVPAALWPAATRTPAAFSPAMASRGTVSGARVTSSAPPCSTYWAIFSK